MTLFSGTKAFIYTRKNKIPDKLFYTWLKEKWIADLKLSAWCIVMSPYILVMLIGSLLIAIGEIIHMGKNILPDCIFLNHSLLREKQHKSVNAVRIFVKHKENAKQALAKYREVYK